MALLNRRREGEVLILELARPAQGNALNRALQDELAEAWEAFEVDADVRLAVLQGSPEVFSIGHDVAELAAAPSTSPVADARMFPLHLSKPVIAAIEGPCYGLGFELALACDLRVAAAGARFGFADPNLYVAYRVAAVLLPRMTFLGASLDLLLSGHLLDTPTMRDFGLVSETVPAQGAASRAVELAHGLSRRFARADSFRKQAIWQLSGLPLPAAMQTARAVR